MSVKTNRALYQLKRETKGRSRADALNSLEIKEVYTTVVQSGGGTFSAFRINEITDGSTYTFPLAASVPAATLIGISLPETYKASTPVVTRAGTDTLTSSEGTDTSITYDGTEWGLVWFTSDGISNWTV